MSMACLDDFEVLAEDFARADVPDGTRVAFMLATMTALQKTDGRGESEPRSEDLARQCKQVEATCAPFLFHQFGLEQNVLSIDGIGAYDHVLEERRDIEVVRRPVLRELLPFVRATCAPQSIGKTQQECDTRSDKLKGGDKADQLMFLFSLAIH